MTRQDTSVTNPEDIFFTENELYNPTKETRRKFNLIYGNSKTVLTNLVFLVRWNNSSANTPIEISVSSRQNADSNYASFLQQVRSKNPAHASSSTRSTHNSTNYSSSGLSHLRQTAPSSSASYNPKQSDSKPENNSTSSVASNKQPNSRLNTVSSGLVDLRSPSANNQPPADDEQSAAALLNQLIRALQREISNNVWMGLGSDCKHNALQKLHNQNALSLDQKYMQLISITTTHRTRFGLFYHLSRTNSSTTKTAVALSEKILEDDYQALRVALGIQTNSAEQLRATFDAQVESVDFYTAEPGKFTL